MEDYQQNNIGRNLHCCLHTQVLIFLIHSIISAQNCPPSSGLPLCITFSLPFIDLTAFYRWAWAQLLDSRLRFSFLFLFSLMSLLGVFKCICIFFSPFVSLYLQCDTTPNAQPSHLIHFLLVLCHSVRPNMQYS